MKQIMIAIVILLATLNNSFAGNSVYIQQDNQNVNGSVYIKQDGSGNKFAISTSAILIRYSDSEPLVIGAYRQAFATLIFLPLILKDKAIEIRSQSYSCLLYTSPSPRDS